MASSFSAEMTEIAYILHNVKEDITDEPYYGNDLDGAKAMLPDLVLIDELGRGSSVADGLAISLAITDWLVRVPVNQKLVTTFMSTHFHDLAKAMGARPGVALINMKADVSICVIRLFFFSFRYLHFTNKWLIPNCQTIFSLLQYQEIPKQLDVYN